METAGEDTSWLDATPTDDGWLDISDPNAGKTTHAFRHLIDSCMRGTDRVMACDGHYLAYRPYNREFDKATNPRTRERFNDFIAAGHYKHLGTYDEVQIYELLEGSPFRHTRKDYVVGVDIHADVRKVALAAYERKWSDYHDLLGGMATAMKSGKDPFFAKAMWEDTLNRIAVTIGQMKGAPTEREINEGFIEIRRARGIAKGGIIALNSSKLEKVGF